MSNNNPKNTKFIYAIAIGLTVVVSMMYFSSNSEITIIKNDKAPVQLKPDPLTIAGAWQGEIKTPPSAEQVQEAIKNPTAEVEESEEPAKISLDYDFIHEKIGKIRLTESGEVVIDEETLEALREAFPRGELSLTPEMLDELKDILEKGLPGGAGQQAAEIVSNFYEFLVAKNEMSDVYRDINLSSDNHQSVLSEIKSLRELYLGKDVADKLFKVEDQNADYMTKAFEIAASKELTKEEKIEKRAELNKTMFAPDVSNWPERYDTYRADLVKLREAGLENKALRSAIDKLQSKHFSEDELKKINKSNALLEN